MVAEATLTPIDLDNIAAQSREIDRIARNKANPAGYAIERLAKMLHTVELNLPPDHELGIAVGNAPAFHLRKIEASNPDLVIFKGIDEHKNRVWVVQHHSQTNIVMTVLPKLDDKPHRIGFV